MHARHIRPTGYVIYSGPSLLDGAPIVAILTTRSLNGKTANMAQVWILRADIHPSEAVRIGADASICGHCLHRGKTNPDVGSFVPAMVDRSCYVLVFNAPRSIWEAYRRGSYPTIRPIEAARLIAGRPVRLGAYGDPAALPIRVCRSVTKYAPKRSGYTHQWKTCAGLKSYTMASVDSVTEAEQATADGWRYFRVSADGRTLPGEIVCPASKEAGHRTTCEKCGLCDGRRGPDDRRANIAILAHGGSAVRFIRRVSELEVHA